MSRFVYYTGQGRVRAALRSGLASIVFSEESPLWLLDDDGDAQDLLSPRIGGNHFAPAMPVSEACAKYGRTAEEIARLPQVTVVSFAPRDGGEEVPVLALTREALAQLKSERVESPAKETATAEENPQPPPTRGRKGGK